VLAVGRLLGDAKGLGDLPPRPACGKGPAHLINLEPLHLAAQVTDRCKAPSGVPRAGSLPGRSDRPFRHSGTVPGAST
jgi:hypothetical protein